MICSKITKKSYKFLFTVPATSQCYQIATKQGLSMLQGMQGLTVSPRKRE